MPVDRLFSSCYPTLPRHVTTHLGVDMSLLPPAGFISYHLLNYLMRF